MWKIIRSGEMPFKPYPKGISNIKRVLEKDKAGTARIAGFGLIEVPPGGVFGPHLHPEREEIYYVLSGTGSVLVGGEEIPAEEGLTLYVSGEDLHGLKNEDEEPLTVIFVTVYK
jgi:mannose-6-phosphate isomerase-like protein (cupin superfamily)